LVFGVSIDEVSLAYLFERQETREALLEADRCLAKRQGPEALLALALALAKEFRARKLDREVRLGSWPPLRSDDGKALTPLLKQLGKAVIRLSESVQLLEHGMDPHRLALFRELTPSVFIADAGNVRSVGNGKPDPTEEDLRFCYDFVVDTVLDLQ